MTRPSLAFSSAEIGRMPQSLAFDLAEQLLALGRPSDALALACSVEFEACPAQPWAQADPHAPSVSRHGAASGFERAMSLAARCAGAQGVESALEALISRGGGSLPAFESCSNPPEPSEPWQVPVRSAFDALFKIDPQAAQAMLLKAPSWLCLQGAGPSAQSVMLSPSQGLGLALSGELGPELELAYFERQQFAAQFGRPSELLARRLQSAAKLLAHEWSREEGPGDGALERFAHLAFQEARKAPLPSNLADSPLPHRWVGAIAFGPRQAIVEALERWLGPERMDAICARETSPRQAARDVRASGRLGAWSRLLRTHGAKAFEPPREGMETSLVARAAKGLGAHDFKAFLERAQEICPEALRQSCQQRFWAFVEGSARKMGDALAFCAAEGLPAHAKALLETLPDLPRKDVGALLKYLESRPVSDQGGARASWESVLLDESSAPQSSPARARARL